MSTDKKLITESPCVGICSATNLGDEICMGCGRTFDEVLHWNQYSDEKKDVINRRLMKEQIV